MKFEAWNWFSAGLLILAFATLYTLSMQALSWLQYGYAPEGDLFWLLQWDRTIQRDGWVGLNKIMFWLYDTHIGTLTLLYFVVVGGLASWLDRGT